MEFIDHEASSLNIKVADDIMLPLIKVVVIQAFGLILEDLLPIGVNWGHHCLFFSTKVMVVQIFVLHVKDEGANALTSKPLPLYLEHHHAIIKASCEVVQSGMS
jgi:hypothetical protein